MRRPTLIATPAILVFGLSACGGASSDTAQSSAAPTPASSAASSVTSSAAPTQVEESSATASAPASAAFVDVVDDALAAYSALIGSPASTADLAGALPLFDSDAPLPDGNVVGAGRVVEEWGDTLESIQMIGVDIAPSKDALEAYGAAAPQGWAYNSISTTDSSSTLVMTRESDGLRVVLMSSKDPGPGSPAAEFWLEADASEIPQPAWLASLPVPDGGELIAVGEGIGEVEVDYFPAVGGLVSATWRFPADQLTPLQEFYASGALEAAGFTLVDPDAITVGASYFDVQAEDWTGQVIVGELMEDDDSFATVQWFLTRP
ncbi:MAG: hypothetical protein FJW85_00125 [Actinobacteria bacterium]|nr:hypothetical protein [Actinomycetota bacterium]